METADLITIALECMVNRVFDGETPMEDSSQNLACSMDTCLGAWAKLGAISNFAYSVSIDKHGKGYVHADILIDDVWTKLTILNNENNEFDRDDHLIAFERAMAGV